MSGLTANEFKSTNINGILQIKDYSGITATLQTDSIQPLTTSLTISGVVYIPYSVWTSLGSNYYDQFATGYNAFLDQFS